MKHLDDLLHLQLYYSMLYCKIDMKHLIPLHKTICFQAVFLYKILFPGNFRFIVHSNMCNGKKEKLWSFLQSRNSDCCSDPAPIQYHGHLKDQLVHSWSTTQSKQTKNPKGWNLFPVNIWVISKYSSTVVCPWTICKQPTSAKFHKLFIANSLPLHCDWDVCH